MKKCLGLIGGWTAQDIPTYVRLLHREVEARMGKDAMANLFTRGLDRQNLVGFVAEGNWSEIVQRTKLAVERLESVNVEGIALCSSLQHAVAAKLGAEMEVPLLHMGEMVAAALRATKFRRVGLLGTRCPEEERMWAHYLAGQGILETLTPVPKDGAIIHRILDEEAGLVNETSCAEVAKVVGTLKRAGAKAVVLVAPELVRLLIEEHNVLPVFDAVSLHVQGLADWMLEDEGVQRTA